MTTDTHGSRGGINWRIVGWGAAGLVLLLPLAAMQFTDEVRWDGADFIFAGVLIGSVGLTYELAVRRSRDWTYRAAVAAALAAAFLLVWANGAVGIIGDEDNPANLLFGLVLLVALVGSVVVRFRPAGMARVLLAAAVLQLLVTLVALATSWNTRASFWPRELFFSVAGFGGLWLASAWLFHKAARKSAQAD